MVPPIDMRCANYAPRPSQSPPEAESMARACHYLPTVHTTHRIETLYLSHRTVGPGLRPVVPQSTNR